MLARPPSISVADASGTCGEEHREGRDSLRAPAFEPRTFGKYRLLAPLGHGGMADVYLAAVIGPAGFNKLQVLKCIRPGLAWQPELRTMFLDEARLASRLNHRNVVQTNEVGIAEGQYFIAMEYLDGQPLNRVLVRAHQRRRPLSLGAWLRILRDVLMGLHYAHELADYDGTPLEVVHRDISPHNVFITYDGQVKVVDFGIAKAARRAIETQTGIVKGKVGYMAPEQAFSSSDVDRRADLFSVGVMLWEAISGRRLWDGRSEPQIIAGLMREIPKVSGVSTGTPDALAAICDRALALAPEDRYSTAAEFRAELEACIERFGPQPTAEELGGLVSELFESERAELRSLIHRQMEGPVAQGDDDPPATVREPATARPSRVSEAPPGMEAPHSMFRAVLKPVDEERARGKWVPFAVAAAVVVGAVSAFLLSREAAETQATAKAAASSATTALAASLPAAAPSAAEVPAQAEGSYVRVRIGVQPAEAKILLDGAALPENPFEGKFVKDGAVHRIQLEAGGFLPKSQIAVFDKDVDIQVMLQPRPKAPGADAPVELPGAKPDPYGPPGEQN